MSRNQLMKKNETCTFQSICDIIIQKIISDRDLSSRHLSYNISNFSYIGFINTNILHLLDSKYIINLFKKLQMRKLQDKLAKVQVEKLEERKEFTFYLCYNPCYNPCSPCTKPECPTHGGDDGGEGGGGGNN